MSSLNPLNLEVMNDLRDRVNGNTSVTSLTPEQSKLAMADKHSVLDYPEVERAYIDPEYDVAQRYTLHTFIPAKGATPDQDGVYGILKIRGAFSNVEEANSRADKIVSDIDSYNRIFTCRMGFPIPLMSADGLKKSNHPTHKINVNTKVTEEFGENIRNKIQDEQRRVREIKDRERELIEDVKRTEDPPEERYTVLRTKRAQHSITVMKNIKLVATMIELVYKYNDEIREMELKDDTLEPTYMKRYLDACEKSGIDQSTQDAKDMVNALKEVPDDFYEYDITFHNESIIKRPTNVDQTLS